MAPNLLTCVSDTSPLNYLILIGADQILPRLFHNVLIAPSILEELSHAKTPYAVRNWIANRPAWIEIATAKPIPNQILLSLHAGERDAITIAVESHRTLLIDERDGSEIARRLGVKTVGTLGLLDVAAERGWLDLRAAFDRLRATSFRAPIAVMAALLRKHNSRHRKH